MRNKYEQLSLFDNYSIASDALENDKPKFFRLMDDLICWDEIIPYSFYEAFYAAMHERFSYHIKVFFISL